MSCVRCGRDVVGSARMCAECASPAALAAPAPVGPESSPATAVARTPPASPPAAFSGAVAAPPARPAKRRRWPRVTLIGYALALVATLLVVILTGIATYGRDPDPHRPPGPVPTHPAAQPAPADPAPLALTDGGRR